MAATCTKFATLLNIYVDKYSNNTNTLATLIFSSFSSGTFELLLILPEKKYRNEI